VRSSRPKIATPRKSWLEIALEPARWIFSILRPLSTDDGTDGDDGDGSNIDARRTSRTKARNSSHSTDTVGNSIHSTDMAGSSCTGNTRSSPEIRFLFRPKRQRQNAAREPKPIPLPPMQLRAVFSCFTSSRLNRWYDERLPGLFGPVRLGPTGDADILTDPPVRGTIELDRVGGVFCSDTRKSNHWSSG
jgi:hypothetical protein